MFYFVVNGKVVEEKEFRSFWIYLLPKPFKNSSIVLFLTDNPTFLKIIGVKCLNFRWQINPEILNSLYANNCLG